MKNRWVCLLTLSALASSALACSVAPAETEDVAHSEQGVTAPPVQLVYAWQYSGGRYGTSWTWTRFRVAVANIAPDKKVEVFAEGKDGRWKVIPAKRISGASSDREIWEAEEPSEPLGKFAIRYEVAGQTHWDNNAGNDYRLEDSGGYFAAGVNVMDAWHWGMSEPSADRVHVEVDVRNLGHHKNVGVAYTTDGWATVRHAWLSFVPDYFYGYGMVHSPNVHGVERWAGDLDATGASEIQYAIEYSVGGRTYWDNNLGANYVVRRSQ